MFNTEHNAKTTNHLVSVIVPCYNQVEFLTEALNSVLAQTYQNWECIIVNDGSTDHTEAIAQLYTNKDFRFIYLKKNNKGLSSARNAGMKIARGEFIQLLDSDDLIEEQKLEKQIKILIANRDIALVYGEVRYFESRNLTDQYLSYDLSNKEWMPELSGSKETILNHLMLGNIMACNCPLFRTNCIPFAGYFDENLFNHEDYDYWNRMALSGFQFHFDNSVNTKALVRVHHTSMTRNSKMEIGFSLVQLKLFIGIMKNNFNIPIAENIIKHEKKKFTQLYLKQEISAEHLKMIFRFSEKLRLSIISVIPKKLRYYFLVFNIADLRRKLKI